MHPDDNPYAEHDHRSDLLAKISTEEELLRQWPNADGPHYPVGIDHAIYNIGHGVYAAICGVCGHVSEYSWQAGCGRCPRCEAELTESMDGVELLAERVDRLTDADLTALSRSVEVLRDRLRAEVHQRVERLDRRAAA
ncbi:hypothetical protein MARPU_05615 [Marichromatium purpuratum 984]|uniref:Uncharacterized protein n=1 Tax=Marichromatium purpuratum 984 TaxID=765910 RepID=W0E846_MARPU|nr:hypothetical protein [Marichromatium purpuratum]AHF05404.1 hypothetical protein MARPU_05615 [Marichromatium purpuratum 984]